MTKDVKKVLFGAAGIVLSWTLIAHGQSYLVETSQSAALARSQSQCVALNCDETTTLYWWAIVGPLTAGLAGTTPVGAGSYAILIGNPPFGVTTTNKVATAGLSTAEQSSLVSASAISSLLPSSASSSSAQVVTP